MYVSKFNVDGKSNIKVKDAEARVLIDGLESDVNEMQGLLAGLDGTVQSEINALQQSVNNQLAQADQKITSNTEQISGLKTRMTRAESNIDELIDDTESLDLRVTNNAGGVIRNGANIHVLEARVNQLTNLPEGSTAGDAELADIRVGVDGITYSSAGDAVREQVMNLANSVKNNYPILRDAPEGGYSFTIGTINAETGLNSQSTTRVRTQYYMNKLYPMAVYMDDDVYSYAVYGYTLDQAAYVRKITESFVIGSYPTVIPDDIGSVRIVFKLAADDDHTMTDADMEAIGARLKLMYDAEAYAVNAKLTQSFTDDEKDMARTNIGAASKDVLDLRTSYTIDQSSLGFSYGGLRVDSGYSNEDPTRLRYLAPDGTGAILVGAGSTVMSNPGYKFNVALYSSYESNSKFVLIGGVHMMSGTYTIQEDCYARISFGSTDDAVLWTNVDGVNTLTADGITALASALVLNLVGGTVKEKIETLEAGIATGIKTIDNIPLNAVAYHALWQEMVDAGFLTVTPGADLDNDPNLPMKRYRLCTDMAHMAPDYNVVSWTGSNELYQKPKVLVTSGIHGNERTTPMAVLSFVQSLWKDAAYQHLRNLFDWYFIPLINPWGFSHTALKNGVVNNGFGLPLSDYNIVENSSTYHQGIRYNSDGVDPNRDFDAQHGFQTAEAQYVRSCVADILAQSGSFAFTIDCHQAPVNNSNSVGAFLSVTYGAPQATLDTLFNKWMQAGAKTEVLMAEYTDKPLIQSVFPWQGTDLATLRNYLGQFTDYGMCFEGDQTCTYYSNSRIYSNDITRTFVNTQFHNFMDRLCELWT